MMNRGLSRACGGAAILLGALAGAGVARAETDELSILAERPPPTRPAGPFLMDERLQTAAPERVRGRRLPEGAEEDDYISRTEVTTPARLAPYGYVDSGTSRDFAGRPITPVTAGAGFAWRMSERASVRLLSSYVVSSGPVTRPGDVGVGLSLHYER